VHLSGSTKRGTVYVWRAWETYRLCFQSLAHLLVLSDGVHQLWGADETAHVSLSAMCTVC